MSLKAFHIIFVTLATLLCVFLALWAFLRTDSGGTLVTVLGIAGIIGAIGLPVYVICFLRKAKKMNL